MFRYADRAQERHDVIAQGEAERGADRGGVDAPDDRLRLRREVRDEVEAVAGVGKVLGGAGDVGQAGAQHVLDDGARDGGPDGRAELGEDVEAGCGDCLVGFFDVVDWEKRRHFFCQRRKEGGETPLVTIKGWGNSLKAIMRSGMLTPRKKPTRTSPAEIPTTGRVSRLADVMTGTKPAAVNALEVTPAQ